MWHVKVYRHSLLFTQLTQFKPWSCTWFWEHHRNDCLTLSQELVLSTLVALKQNKANKKSTVNGNIIVMMFFKLQQNIFNLKNYTELFLNREWHFKWFKRLIIGPEYHKVGICMQPIGFNLRSPEHSQEWFLSKRARSNPWATSGVAHKPKRGKKKKKSLMKLNQCINYYITKYFYLVIKK